MTLFVDGNANYPSCRCKPDCEFPCWQMVGLSDDPCGPCGCAPFDYKPVVLAHVAAEDEMSESVSWCHDASTPLAAHACNCVGCCRKCGTCRTWHGHTADYCALLVRQQRERLDLLAAEDRAATVHLYGEERVRELEREANRG